MHTCTCEHTCTHKYTPHTCMHSHSYTRMHTQCPHTCTHTARTRTHTQGFRVPISTVQAETRASSSDSSRQDGDTLDGHAAVAAAPAPGHSHGPDTGGRSSSRQLKPSRRTVSTSASSHRASAPTEALPGTGRESDEATAGLFAGRGLSPQRGGRAVRARRPRSGPRSPAHRRERQGPAL